MKIIKQGKVPNENLWIGHCSTCGSIAEAHEHELNLISTDARTHELFSWLTCPVCRAGERLSGYQGMLFKPKHQEHQFEIWSEGFRGTGGQGNAVYMGKYTGKNFADAVLKYSRTLEPDSIVLLDLNKLTYCGCKLFSNEKDAKASFG